MVYFGWLFLGLLIGAGLTYYFARFGKFGIGGGGSKTKVVALVTSHFKPVAIDNVTISERKFPFRVRADLQKAIDQLFSEETKVLHFCGVRKEFSHEGVSLTDCLVGSSHYPTLSVPPEYEEIDVGDDLPVRVLKVGLWLLEKNGIRFVVLLTPAGQFGQVTGIQFQVGTPNVPEGTQIAQAFYKHLEDAILKADSYRGKVLSLEQAKHSYTGESSGITVHRLRQVDRCLLYTSPSPRDQRGSRMPSSA